MISATVEKPWYEGNKQVDSLFDGRREVTMNLTAFYEFVRSAGGMVRPEEQVERFIDGTGYNPERGELTFSRDDLRILTFNERDFWDYSAERVARRITQRESGVKPIVLKAMVFDALWIDPNYQRYLQRTEPNAYWDEVRSRMADVIIDSIKQRDEKRGKRGGIDSDALARVDDAVFYTLMDTRPEFQDFVYATYPGLRDDERKSPIKARYKVLTGRREDKEKDRRAMRRINPRRISLRRLESMLSQFLPETSEDGVFEGLPSDKDLRLIEGIEPVVHHEVEDLAKTAEKLAEAGYSD